ncbi:MAG: hypothetical protein OXG15_01030 [Gammaproteobacteria bacterium]|nr:hypothetical protein [Gammaproteobacteria bacterium]
MKGIRTHAVVLVILVSVTIPHAFQNKRVLECGSVFNSETNFDSLIRTFGVSNVIEAEIHGSEGFYHHGALIFPGSEDEVEIFWGDPHTQQSLRRVRISGRQSSWKLPSGLELGMDLQSIEAHNRKPFRLTGFGWDYGGTIVSWENGYLAPSSSESCRVIIRLGYDTSEYTKELILKHGSVMGSSSFSSGHPTMQELKPFIREISLFLD